ncbi:APC family permease [Peribacillus glennii]|uniref:Amino acid permease n=1 Tax=Peribacillus glennii TaxID=2303991 RepID=A0A372L7B3_9BACI|nr:APC family permease [Peribacillus glennii]RFU61111.1 amino acid permease [Peribacillus glennii]
MLNRVLGKWLLLFTGYATVVASGFMIGVGGAAEVAGPLTFVSYIVFGGLATFATAFVFSELATMFPKCGGVWEYTKQAFGNDHPFSFMVGWIYWFALLFGLNVELVSVGIYLHELVPAIPQWLGALATALVFIIFNMVGVKLSTIVEAGFGIILIVSSALFIMLGLGHLDIGLYKDFAPHGTVMPILQTLPFVVIAFCGFEVVATLAEESKNPSKDIPKALIGAATFLTVLFGGFATILFGLLPASELSTDAPLLKAGSMIFGGIGLAWLSVQSFSGSMSTVNGGVMGQTRVMYAMAREGWFGKVFAKVDEKRGVPKASLYFTGGSMIVVSLLPTITENAWVWAGFLGVFGYALSYIVACFLVMYLRSKRPDLKRPYKVPLYPVTPILGIVLYLLAIIFSGIQIIIVGGIWCLVGVGYYYLFGRKSRAKHLEISPEEREAI